MGKLLAATALAAALGFGAIVGLTDARAATFTSYEDIGVLTIEGYIELNDGILLSQGLVGAKMVFINSPGGIQIAAFKMAELIRESGVAVVVVDTCNSACTLLWGAAQKRYVINTPEMFAHRTGIEVAGKRIPVISGTEDMIYQLKLYGLYGLAAELDRINQNPSEKDILIDVLDPTFGIEYTVITAAMEEGK